MTQALYAYMNNNNKKKEDLLELNTYMVGFSPTDIHAESLSKLSRRFFSVEFLFCSGLWAYGRVVSLEN
jgi:hypothetical protein